jgi:hypothetical protein
MNTLIDSQKRRCYYLDQNHQNPKNNKQFVVALVFENESGFFPMTGQGQLSIPWYWDEETCKLQNQQAFNLTEMDVIDIISSSMRRGKGVSNFLKNKKLEMK